MQYTPTSDYILETRDYASYDVHNGDVDLGGNIANQNDSVIYVNKGTEMFVYSTKNGKRELITSRKPFGRTRYIITGEFTENPEIEIDVKVDSRDEMYTYRLMYDSVYKDFYFTDTAIANSRPFEDEFKCITEKPKQIVVDKNPDPNKVVEPEDEYRRREDPILKPVEQPNVDQDLLDQEYAQFSLNGNENRSEVFLNNRAYQLEYLFQAYYDVTVRLYEKVNGELVLLGEYQLPENSNTAFYADFTKSTFAIDIEHADSDTFTRADLKWNENMETCD